MEYYHASLDFFQQRVLPLWENYNSFFIYAGGSITISFTFFKLGKYYEKYLQQKPIQRIKQLKSLEESLNNNIPKYATKIEKLENWTKLFIKLLVLYTIVVVIGRLIFLLLEYFGFWKRLTIEITIYEFCPFAIFPLLTIFTKSFSKYIAWRLNRWQIEKSRLLKIKEKYYDEIIKKLSEDELAIFKQNCCQNLKIDINKREEDIKKLENEILSEMESNKVFRESFTIYGSLCESVIDFEWCRCCRKLYHTNEQSQNTGPVLDESEKCLSDCASKFFAHCSRSGKKYLEDIDKIQADEKKLTSKKILQM